MKAPPNALIERLLDPLRGPARGLLKIDSAEKLVKIRVGELRDIQTGLKQLDDECGRAWRAYEIAHNQAMSNGAALVEIRSELAALKRRAA